jgi:hypothetical protein
MIIIPGPSIVESASPGRLRGVAEHFGTTITPRNAGRHIIGLVVDGPVNARRCTLSGQAHWPLGGKK